MSSPRDSSAVSTATPHSVTVVVPVFNERDSLPELVTQLQTSVRPLASGFQIIFVDDGSTDGSWEIIAGLAAAQADIRGIRLRRNFGKAAALTAGMQAASGSLILMLDADLQDDPAEFPALLAQIDRGADLVNGWKQRRLDPWHKVYPSRIFNWMIGRLTGLKLHDHNCGLKLFRADVARELRIYGELHRFIPVLAHARGFKVTEIVVNHRPRQHGHSKYGVRRFLRGFLDLLTVTFLTGYGRRPLHALGAVGLAVLAVGVLGLLYLSGLWVVMKLNWVTPDQPIGSRPLLAYSIALTLLGGQVLSVGLLAELLVARLGVVTDQFSIRETTPPV